MLPGNFSREQNFASRFIIQEISLKYLQLGLTRSQIMHSIDREKEHLIRFPRDIMQCLPMLGLILSYLGSTEFVEILRDN